IKNAPQFLGMIQQRYRPRKGAPVKSFEKWMAAIRDAVDSILVPNLEKITCIIPRDKVQHAINKTTVSGDLSAYDLAHISDFNSLIAISQQLATPVFSISDQQIRDSGQFGHALNTMKSSRDAFNEQFKGLAQRVLELTK
ncbi:TPA: hypothetical protein ACG64D_005440, partial [Escherichia coli]|nr:hypothetical protein [Escherichia coli]HCS8576941.1 hypothetical protein [Escherichia coli]